MSSTFILYFRNLKYICERIFNRRILQFQTKPIRLLSGVEEFRNIYDIPLEFEPLTKHFQLIKDNADKLYKQYDKSNSCSNELNPVLHLIQEIEIIKKDIKELETLRESVETTDQSLKAAVAEEYAMYIKRMDFLKCQILDLIVPSEYIDNKNIILEISAGVGGKEAALFTKDLLDMYCNFAVWKGWKYEILQYNKSELDGLRSGIIKIMGQDTGKFLKFEGGVHRVQRVPKTERHGRIHTSVSTVAILPQPSDVEVKLDNKDLIIETKKSSGAGGQHVNTTDSCVRITHLPSGITVERQTERDQHLNKKRALEALRSILYQKQIKEMESKQHSNRKLQIGTGARSEKVRTYNFVQDRITDHRVNENVYGMEEFLKGQQKLEKLITTLLDLSKLERLLEIIQK